MHITIFSREFHYMHYASTHNMQNIISIQKRFFLRNME